MSRGRAGRGVRSGLAAAAIAVALLSTAAEAGTDKGGRWLAYYAADASVADFAPYDLLVLDSRHHPPLWALEDRGKMLLGYISLGEVENQRPWFKTTEGFGILLGENPVWTGSFFVDVRDPRWTALVIEEVIPDILRRGFHGLFLDTLDNPSHLERTDPKTYAGMTAAAVRLVRAIRRNYPTIPIMMNRAYELLPAVEDQIDMMLGESVYADYDFETKRYGLVDPALYRQQVDWLKAAQARRPALKIMTLDYWDPADRAGIKRIYEVERANGFEPYVATINLDRIIPEPGS